MSRYFPCIEQYESLRICFQCLSEWSNQDELNIFVSEFYQYMKSVLRHYAENPLACDLPELENMSGYCEKFEIETELSDLGYCFIKNYWDCFERGRSLLQKKLEQSVPICTSMLDSDWEQADEEVGIRPCR